jgi:uncharacterized tellurite resistance protein B-like protein
MLFDRIRAALAGSVPEADAGAEPDEGSPVEIACAALLAEAAGMDEKFDPVERRTILTLLERRFQIDGPAAERLLEQGKVASAEASSYYRFTRAINDSWGDEARTELIYLLWSVACADGRIDPYEDMLVRRVAGLLHVSDRARGEARRRAVASLPEHSQPTEDCP